eukprot:4097907-Alexandrium_andersonii.AAC.1
MEGSWEALRRERESCGYLGNTGGGCSLRFIKDEDLSGVRPGASSGGAPPSSAPGGPGRGKGGRPGPSPGPSKWQPVG